LGKKKKEWSKMFKQYQYDKYEKVEFDMNTIDSAMMKSKYLKEWNLFSKMLTLQK
jgi:hypothetical protein